MIFGGNLGEIRGRLLRRWCYVSMGGLETRSKAPWAPAHDLMVTPINFRVVLWDPGVSQDQGELGNVIRWSWISSWWFPDTLSLRGTVAWVMWPMFWPLREQATRGRSTAMVGTPQRAAVAVSRKLSSVPESRRAEVFRAPPLHSRETGRQVRLLEESSIGMAPSSAPLLTSGHFLLTGTERQSGPACSNRSRHGPCDVAHVPSPSP